MSPNIRFMSAALALAAATSSQAAATPEETKALGTTLLPWGAEKAGNKEGTIPAYTGEKINVPASYDPKKPGARPDPFPDDKPLYSISAANLDKYANIVAPGYQAMFKKYSTFRMDVYPTRRTAIYPKWVQDNSTKNATSCKVVGDNEWIEGCYGGVPFPIPKNGVEVVWNKNMAFVVAGARSAISENFLVTPSGQRVRTGSFGNQYFTSPYYDPARATPASKDLNFLQWRGDVIAPDRNVGEKWLYMWPMTMNVTGTNFFAYYPGQRRVKMSPDVAYDTPQPAGGGASVIDEVRVYSGAMDRYDFKLVGKKEMLIPYNTFKASTAGGCPIEKLYTKNHLNPDCLRWELHRVWEVQATLKPGKRHVYPTRTMYFDEDNPGAAIGENYDAAGKIYRVALTLSVPMYETEGFSSDSTVIHDLQTGAYNPFHAPDSGWYQMPVPPKNYYTPDALGTAGVR